MIALVQRVSEASVTVDDKTVSEIGKGLVVLLGVAKGDKDEDAGYLLNKITNLRIFDDENGKMNLSLFDIKGEMLVVSQFTLLGDCRKGRRPGFEMAALSEEAERFYEKFINDVSKTGIRVKKGIFAANMLVKIFNDGPVTFILDSKKL
ncbi:MAG: D-tyrosyl-tRNA(Tyr) deacylase [Nitrospinae bacterium]|nr:D-tyrosyl-tRNA(Tyr) deacylase [Nitrospinota bacterium]